MLNGRSWGCASKFGLTSTVSLIAWRVDFNLSLPSFEVDLKGVRNFIELALSSPYDIPPKINFVSSVGIFGSMFLAMSPYLTSTENSTEQDARSNHPYLRSPFPRHTRWTPATPSLNGSQSGFCQPSRSGQACQPS